MRVPEIDAQIRAAWNSRDTDGRAEAVRRCDILLDRRNEIKPPAPYVGPLTGYCRMCGREALKLTVSTELAPVTLTKCRGCDVRACASCGTPMHRPDAATCSSCGRAYNQPRP